MHNRVLNFINTAMQKYRDVTPSYTHAIKILNDNKAIPDSGIKHDHVAIRTFRRNQGFNRIKNILLLGDVYTPMECYTFEAKLLKAQWFKPKSEYYPRVFLSELLDDQLSVKSRYIVNQYIESVEEVEKVSPPIAAIVDDDSIACIDRLINNTLSPVYKPTIDYDDYLELNKESNYAAWTLIHGQIINHETIPVHLLNYPYNDLSSVLKLLEVSGLELLKEPNVIKTSTDGLLLQSSTLSDAVSVKFKHGYEIVPGSFVEYIERKPLPQCSTLPEELVTEENRRDGFETTNAFFIFDSTKAFASNVTKSPTQQYTSCTQNHD